jgi:hypothetical protein
MSSYQKTIDGRGFRFTVKLQPMTKQERGMGYHWPPKVIDVTDGVGFGPATSWADAFDFAKQMASDRSKWRMEQLRKHAVKNDADY